MSDTRSSVPLPEALREQYAQAATADRILLKDLHVRALRAFLGYRLEVLGQGGPFRHFVAPRDVVNVMLTLPDGLTKAARAAADDDGVSLRQLLHTALVWYAESQLTRSRSKSRPKPRS